MRPLRCPAAGRQRPGGRATGRDRGRARRLVVGARGHCAAGLRGSGGPAERRPGPAVHGHLLDGRPDVRRRHLPEAQLGARRTPVPACARGRPPRRGVAPGGWPGPQQPQPRRRVVVGPAKQRHGTAAALRRTRAGLERPGPLCRCLASVARRSTGGLRLRHRNWVDTGKWFIEQNKAGVSGQATRNLHAAALAT